MTGGGALNVGIHRAFEEEMLKDVYAAKKYFVEQRFKDAESGTFALGSHEIAFDDKNEPIPGMMEVPKGLPEDADPAFAAFYNYYVIKARHPHAVNFVSSWTATMPVLFWNFPLMSNTKEVSPVQFCW